MGWAQCGVKRITHELEWSGEAAQSPGTEGFPLGTSHPISGKSFRTPSLGKKIENRSVRLSEVGSLLFTKDWKGGSGRRV